MSDDRLSNLEASASLPHQSLVTNMGSKNEHGEKFENETLRLDEKKTYPSSGMRHFLHGTIAQLKLAMLFVKRGLRHDYNFKLAIEMDWAGNFDDVVFRYETNGSEKSKCRYLQVKHSRDESRKISPRDLLASYPSDFGLQKYFISYRKIRKHPKLSKSELEDCIIYTNIDLDHESLRNAGVGLIRVVEPDHFLDFEHLFKQPARYKLVINDNKDEVYKILRQASDVYALPMKLADCVFNNVRISSIRDRHFRQYWSALANEVIDVVNKRFRQYFVHGCNLSGGASVFRTIFIAELGRLMRRRDHSSSEEEVRHMIEHKRLDLSSAFRQRNLEPTTQWPDDDVLDPEIAEFLDKFVFAVNQPNEVELGHIIAREIAADSRHNFQQINLINDSFWRKVLDWGKRKDGVYLTTKEAKDMFESIEDEVDRVACSALTASCLEELEKSGVEFEGEVEDLENFLNCGSSQNNFAQAFNFIAAGRTFLTAIKVIKTIKRTAKYEMSDSLIFVRLCMLLELPMTKERVIRVFSSNKGFDLMVVDCGSAMEQDLCGLCNELYDMMKGNSDKKLILITKVSMIESTIHLPNCQESYDAPCSFDDLTEDAQRKLKKQLKVNFPKLRKNVLRRIVRNPRLR